MAVAGGARFAAEGEGDAYGLPDLGETGLSGLGAFDAEAGVVPLLFVYACSPIRQWGPNNLGQYTLA